MNIQDIQLKLPWSAKEYSGPFARNESLHKDFQHALIHIMKATGQLAAMVELGDHHEASQSTFPNYEVEKYLADIVICAMRMANTNPSGFINLQQAVVRRIESKNGVKLE
jgi:hypothetical protein